MLAPPVTAFVLALALGTAPMSAPMPPPSDVPDADASAELVGTADEPPTEEPPADVPSLDQPPAEGPLPDVPPADGPPPGESPPEEPPADAAVTDEGLADTAEDPFGDDADAGDEPWPDDPARDDRDAGPLPDYDPLRDSPQALRARHWVRTGIGTAATGGALLIGAIIMGASDPCARGSGNNCQEGARNRAALIMGIPAAILIGGGATMLGLGLSRQRRLAVDLQASRQSFGLAVRGRF